MGTSLTYSASAHRIAVLRETYRAASLRPPANPVNGYSRALLGSLLTILEGTHGGPAKAAGPV